MQSPVLAKKIEELNLRLKDCKDFQEIVDAGSEALGNPMVLYDVAYITWAYTKNVTTDDPLWNELTTTGTFSPDTVAFIQSQFVEPYIKSSGVALMKSSLKCDRVNGAIFDKNGVQIASFIMLDINRPFKDDDFEMLRALCEFAGKRLEGCGKNKHSRIYGEGLMDSLLEGGCVDNILYKQELKGLCSGLKNVHYVAAVDIMHFDSTLTHIVYFNEYFKKIRADFKYFVYMNNIIILMSFPEIVLNIEKELAAFGTFFKRFNIYAGVSGHFSSLSDIKTYFKQALNALNYGMVTDSGNIFSYDNFKIELFVNSHIDEINVCQLCHPLVFRIAEYDKNNGTFYVKLIYTYLYYGADLKLAARNMNLSDDDFKPLFKKAGRLFDIDWKNGSLLFALLRSIRLLKCFPEKFETPTCDT